MKLHEKNAQNTSVMKITSSERFEEMCVMYDFYDTNSAILMLFLLLECVYVFELHELFFRCKNKMMYQVQTML